MDLLYYRYPAQPIVRQSGSFGLGDGLPFLSSFVVSDFEKRNVFLFNELPGTGEFHFQQNAPYVATKREYIMGGENLLQAMHVHDIQKVVYSRVKRVAFKAAHSTQLFDALCAAYPKAFVYLISSKHFGTWVGATPELLLSAKDDLNYTMSLAGTKPAGSKTNQWTEKEREEQRMVTEFITQEIQKIKATELEVSEPYIFQAGPVEHLRSDFSFVCKDTYVLDIAKQLHPTPAVAGVPMHTALDWIKQVEHNDRQLYAGFLGKLNKEGSHFYVNLRCCQIQENAAYLYVGGGYTKDSLPEDEWMETENKAKTLLNVIEKIGG